MTKSFILGIIAGTLCTISFLPQVIKIFKAKTARDISLATFSILAVGVFLWLVYGIMIGELPVILANAVIFILCIIIVIMKIRYG
jgi:MtN3 and saliva related transmembrane protein